MHHIRRGSGSPLLLVHGIGGNTHSFDTVLDMLAADREVIVVDLPGFGGTPPLEGEVSIRTLCDALTGFLREQELIGIDAVGSSMGARLVLELARRGGVLGAVVSLDPGGFWRGWERHAFNASIWLSIRLIRALQPVLPQLTASDIGRTLLLLQFSARRRALAPRGTTRHPLVIGWGRRDRVCFPNQAGRAQALFPDARIHWFEHCGHFPHWDAPEESVRLILATTGDEDSIHAPGAGGSASR